MSERNRLGNGRFLNNLNSWTVSGAVYSAGDGDDHYGVAVLGTGGDYIQQVFSVPDYRLYTAHISGKSTTGFTGSEIQLVITDGDGNTVLTENLEAGADTWVENTFVYGLAPGTSYTFKVINNSAGEDVKIDDIWVWFVPITRAEIAARVDDRLADLADEQNYSTAIDGAKTEGDYTYSVDAGLRAVNAINNETGLPDVRYLSPGDVAALIDAAELDMLKKLQREYATKVDITTGPVRQNLSQIGESIQRLTGTAGGSDSNGKGGRIEMRPIKRS